MADAAPKVHAEDLVPVRSRISWGAILAGAMVALSIFYLLNLLGAAIGISVTGRVPGDRLQIGAVIWAVVVSLISLFLGGWVASQLAVGENKLEAAIYGVIVWGTMFTILLVLIANAAVTLGFAGLVSLGSNPYLAAQADERLNEEAAQRKGTTTDRAKAAVVTEDFRRGANAAWENMSKEEAQQAAWWSFGGILLSMIASVLGAVAGAGPTMVLQRVFVRPTVPVTRP